jgi:predicted DCC family thiol-disulfide oxidoreductase YuxK
MKPTFVFDGYCGFCTRAVNWMKRQDRHHRLEFRAWQQPGVLETHGLTQQDVRFAAWFANATTRYSGAGAIAAALSVAWGTNLPLIAYHLTRCAQDAAYRLIADNRRRLPGVRAFCKLPGSDCQAGTASCVRPGLPHA